MTKKQNQVLNDKIMAWKQVIEYRGDHLRQRNMMTLQSCIFILLIAIFTAGALIYGWVTNKSQTLAEWVKILSIVSFSLLSIATIYFLIKSILLISAIKAFEKQADEQTINKKLKTWIQFGFVAKPSKYLMPFEPEQNENNTPEN